MITKVLTNTLVIGADKWFVENCIAEEFIWLGYPFENSKAKAFITPVKKKPLNISFTLVVDLAEAFEADLLALNPDNTIFYSEKWQDEASKVASFIKNIVVFKENSFDIVKKDYKIMKIC
ncbi:MAG: hypothetical protein ACOX2F_10740 [bacterium]